MKTALPLALASLMMLSPLGMAAETTGTSVLAQQPAWDCGLMFLAVHPDSDAIVQREDVQAVIAAGNGRVLRLPAELGMPYYILMPQPRRNDEDNSLLLDEQGKPVVDYLVVRDPDAAMKDGKSITLENIESMEQDSGRQTPMINITLTDTGAQHMRKLTGKMKLGRDRLAISLHGYVIKAPIVHVVLGKHCQISGLTQQEVDEILSKK